MIDTLPGIKHPTSLSEHKTFLRLSNVSCRLVPNVVPVATPLNTNSEKPNCEQLKNSFMTVGLSWRPWKKLLEPSITGCSMRTRLLYCEKYQGYKQMGCVHLESRLNGTESPVRYWYRYIIITEYAYDTIHHGCLASVRADALLCPYLQCCQFTIKENQTTIKGILNLTHVTGYLGHWPLRLSEN